MDNHELTSKFMYIMRIHHRAVEQYVNETGLHRAQHRMLMCLSKGQYASQVDLAKHLRVSPATIAVSLKNLERDGYISRKMKEEDNRFNQIYITEKGKKIVDSSRLIFDKIDETMFVGFNEEQKDKMSLLLDQVCENLETLITKKKEEE